MKRSRLEIGVLVIGAVVIISSLLVKFMFDLPPSQTLVISNIVFSLGFLIYIVYSIMTTNSLNREIRRLENTIAGLKKEISEKNKKIQDQQSAIKSLEDDKQTLEGEKNSLQKELEQTKSEISSLQKKVEELTESQNEAKH